MFRALVAALAHLRALGVLAASWPMPYKPSQRAPGGPALPYAHAKTRLHLRGKSNAHYANTRPGAACERDRKEGWRRCRDGRARLQQQRTSRNGGDARASRRRGSQIAALSQREISFPRTTRKTRSRQLATRPCRFGLLLLVLPGRLLAG
jgi:hypothetical protein